MRTGAAPRAWFATTPFRGPMSQAILRDPLLRGLALGGAALIGWLLFGGANPGVQVVAYWTALICFNAVQCVASRRVVRRTEISAPNRRFWRAVSACGA